MTGGFGAWIRAETKRARIGDARIESDFLGKGESKNEGRRDSADPGQETTPPRRRPRSRDSAVWRKARTNGARIAGIAIRSRRDGLCKSTRLRARRFPADRVKGTAPTPGGQGPATARRGGKREQTARESRAARFARDATDVASPGGLSARRFPATGLREHPRPRRPQSRDSALRRKARTNGARIAGSAIRSRRDGCRKPRHPLRSSISGDRVYEA